MICAGIDAGSRAIKVAMMNTDTLDVVAEGLVDQGVAQEQLAGDLFERLLETIGKSRKDVGAVVATGYGRGGISFADKTITEITCHAAGVRHLVRDARTIIDIGGQDSKSIRMNENGDVDDFAMNDRCAAGTGCFLEMVAARLGVTIELLGALARMSRKPAAISNTCAVFAETEIVGLMAEQVPPADIVAGVQASIAARVSSMAGRNIAQPIVFTGGVARIGGMEAALQAVLGATVTVSPQPQMTGAIGAALLAARHINGDKARYGRSTF
jgi:predicted CoA-substrate-specific enzyme activase